MEEKKTVLRQDWRIEATGRSITSISKDKAQLKETIQELKPSPQNQRNKDKFTVPDGKAEKIKIPIDSAFADMVEHQTIFLHDDEMDLIYGNADDD